MKGEGSNASDGDRRSGSVAVEAGAETRVDERSLESESESESEDASRQAKALTWEKREEKGGRGEVLSCVRISFCLVWLGTATEEDAAGADRVTRGQDQETEVRMTCGEDSGFVRGLRAI